MYFLWIYYTASGQLKDRPYIVASAKEGKGNNESIADHYIEKDEVNKQDENKKKENRDIEFGET